MDARFKQVADDLQSYFHYNPQETGEQVFGKRPRSTRRSLVGIHACCMVFIVRKYFASAAVVPLSPFMPKVPVKLSIAQLPAGRWMYNL